MRHVCKEQNDSNHAVSTLQNEKRNKRKTMLLLLFVHCFWLFFHIYISKLCNRRQMGKHRNVQKIANFQLKNNPPPPPPPTTTTPPKTTLIAIKRDAR